MVAGLITILKKYRLELAEGMKSPRICIGMRFARMQMVAGLITILKKYRLELAEGMKSNVVLRISTMVAQPYGGIRLKFIKREGWEQRILQAPSSVSDNRSSVRS
ncbi:unnamed protein product [Arctia plantaginis]|uniref:Cytochrome P450 n=1 Tax=Arctia plantaginis TaxID=874455 RepID=A0A8S0YNE7_ARCPL|nr:unnamed protein product [Arctia plantaginis]